MEGFDFSSMRHKFENFAQRLSSVVQNTNSLVPRHARNFDKMADTGVGVGSDLLRKKRARESVWLRKKR